MFKSIRQNKIKTGLFVALFLVMIYFIVYFICYAMGIGPDGLIIALIISSLATIITYYNSDKIILKQVKARKAIPQEDQKLVNILDSLMVASGLSTKPQLYVVDDDQPNAFATGRNPQHSVICVTTGLLNKLDYYELEGVVAHELSHIKNYDILLSTIVSVMVGFILFLCDRFFYFGGRANDRDNDSNPIMLIIGLIFLILSPIASKLMQLAISRKREFLADASAVELTRNPQGLINALLKLDNDSSAMKNVSNATENLYIVSPFKDKKDGKKKKTSLFSTHPSIQDRIEALENITK